MEYLNADELVMDFIGSKAGRGFEDWLQMKHAEDYTGLDDDMPDAFGEWLDEQDLTSWVIWYASWLEKFAPRNARGEINVWKITP